jgi:hypothetical protein
MKHTILPLLLVSFLTAGCYDTLRDTAGVRGASELGCGEVDVSTLGPGTYVTEGCGERATFTCFHQGRRDTFGDDDVCVREGEIASEDPPPDPPEPPVPSGVDRPQALAAVRGLAQQAGQACREEEGPHGIGEASVVIGPAGTVTSVTLDARFDGSRTGACVSDHLREASLPPFPGPPIRVHVPVYVQAKS